MKRPSRLGRRLFIYLLGLATGAQAALYLYDTFDDGVSELWSGLIAAALLILSIVYIARVDRPTPDE